MYAEIQFGKLGGPYTTQSVECKEQLLDWQKQGLQQTASGYGMKLVTPYMVKYEGKWRRVYSVCYSNVSTEYVVINGTDIVTQIWRA